jgi:ADP-ribosylglycohydrolase/CheY-like chemotaxis protein
MKTILILEDNAERIAVFSKAVEQFGNEYEAKFWRDAHSMCRECEAFFPTAALVSLDHDLNPEPGQTEDPGTGLDVARFLAENRPACPVIVHSTNADRAWSMYNELRFADWVVERVGPIGNDWIATIWFRKAKEFLAMHQNTWPANFPDDHETRLRRALLSLDGLSVGDAFGEGFFGNPRVTERRIELREPPPRPWPFTDDTAMALSIVRCLKRYGHIQRDALALAFAREYVRDPTRGYGGGAHGILHAIHGGTPWQTAAGRAFNGEGSCGNGGAMRSAPIGAYFADDVSRVIAEAKASAEVTHAHPDGQTGAIAVALAAAWMVNEGQTAKPAGHRLIEFVLEHLPKTETHHRLKRALDIPLDQSPRTAASVLGNGLQVTASNTVPFCLWCAARHLDNYMEALWSTVSVYGDIDTNCAIVGGIVASRTAPESIPQEWLKSREAFTV